LGSLENSLLTNVIGTSLEKNHRLSEVLGSPETNSSVGFGNSFPIVHICQRVANTSVPEKLRIKIKKQPVVLKPPEILLLIFTFPTTLLVSIS
jgi:hypothetical protein